MIGNEEGLLTEDALLLLITAAGVLLVGYLLWRGFPVSATARGRPMC